MAQKTGSRWISARAGSLVLGVASLLSLMATGCVTQSASVAPENILPPVHRVLTVHPCRDRSGFTGRDLAGETTRALVEKIARSGFFEVREAAPLFVTCDIERFEEGSALKRWVWPGWGPTIGLVAVTVWERSGDRVLATFRGQASVRAGGLYTIGADQYILGTAIDDVVAQMKSWASTRQPDSENRADRNRRPG